MTTPGPSPLALTRRGLRKWLLGACWGHLERFVLVPSPPPCFRHGREVPARAAPWVFLVSCFTELSSFFPRLFSPERERSEAEQGNHALSPLLPSPQLPLSPPPVSPLPSGGDLTPLQSQEQHRDAAPRSCTALFPSHPRLAGKRVPFIWGLDFGVVCFGFFFCLRF